MFWLGLFVGLIVSSVYVCILNWRCGPMAQRVKELEREIANINLECAQEERRTEALRVIQMNEQQAMRGHGG